MLWTILRVQMLEQEKENVRSRKIAGVIQFQKNEAYGRAFN